MTTVSGIDGEAYRVEADSEVVAWVVDLAHPTMAATGRGGWTLCRQFAVAIAPVTEYGVGETHRLVVAPLSQPYDRYGSLKPVVAAISAGSLDFTLPDEASADAVAHALVGGVVAGWLSVGKRYIGQWRAAVGALITLLAIQQTEGAENV